MARESMFRSRGLALGLGLVLSCFLVGGCDNGTDGAPGAPGVSTGSLTGTVVNALTQAPIVGATVNLSPAIAGVNLVTNGAGSFSATLPAGVYTLTCTVADYETGTATASLVAAGSANVPLSLTPSTPVKLTLGGLPSPIGPGSVVPLSVSVTPYDGSSVTGYQWSQSNSVAVTITNPTSPNATVTLPGDAAYRTELFSALDVPERWRVQGINHFALEEGATVTVTVTVTTTSGTYTADVDIAADLPFAVVNPGIRNVPLGRPVLFNGKTQAAYNWALTTRPAGSAAALDDPTIQHPSFIPDVAGRYIVTVTDMASPDPVEIEIYAGTWVGAITGQDSNGRPNADNCTFCHDGVSAPDQFSEWKETGHAEIFTNNLNTSSHYAEYCFECHTVGYDPASTNNGIDEQGDFAAFLGAGLLGNPSSGNWTAVLANFGGTARMANIQCENCHGPNFGPEAESAHMRGAPRIDISSEVCASCHGEPLRHARYQQWQESGHGNYELAIDEGMRSFCAGCHTGNGFLAWLPNLTDADPANDTADPAVTWTKDEIHPQTCVVCHDPHDIGTTTGVGTDAKMRIQGDTPMLKGGYKVFSAGKGAICMTCHNGRRGLRNDALWPTVTDRDRAPHEGPQADMLMGQNAYFVEVGLRGPHSLIEDTCVTCHMELTPPPAELSYNLTGTNHTFMASDTVCANCHGEFTAQNVEQSVDATSDALKSALESAIHDEIGMQIDLGNTDGVDGEDATGNPISTTIDDIDQVDSVEITEYHGRQAMNITVSGTTYYNVQMAGDTSVSSGGTLLDSTNGQVIAKAGYNYWFVINDKSHGFHNPGFAIEVLTRATEALQALNYTVPT